MRAAGYVRISQLTDASTSTARQRQDIERLAEARGFELVEVFEDIDLSAFKGVTRPGLNDLLDSLEGLDAIIVWRLDRLARNVRELMTIAETLKGQGVALVSVKEGLDFGGPLGTVLLALLGAIAQMESESISMRVTSAQAYLTQLGFWRGGRRPFGWQPVGQDGHFRLLLHPDEAPVLRELIDRVLAGEAIPAICLDFTERNLPAPLNGRWYGPIARSVLKRRGLIGEATRGGALVRSDDGLPVLIAEPLIDRATFDALQLTLAPLKGTQRRKGDRRLLSGLAVCASCGMALHGSALSLAYRCDMSPISTCPSPPSVRAQALDEWVEATFLDAFGRLQVTTPVYHEADPHADERQQYNEAIEELGRELEQGHIRASLYASIVERLQVKLDTLPVSGTAFTEWYPTGLTFADAWASSDLAGRRTLLSNAVECIEVSPAGRGVVIPLGHRCEIIWRS